jgi:hypothetical protein
VTSDVEPNHAKQSTDTQPVAGGEIDLPKRTARRNYSFGPGGLDDAISDHENNTIRRSKRSTLHIDRTEDGLVVIDLHRPKRVKS